MAGTNLAAKVRKVANEKLGRIGVEIGNVVVEGTAVAASLCIRATADTAVLVTDTAELAAAGNNAAAGMAR